MSIQAKLTHSDQDFVIQRPKTKLSKSEKLYKNIHIKQYGNILFQGRYGKKQDTCGQFKSAYSCHCGSKTKIILKSCNNLNCPNCHIVVNRRSTKRITERILKILQFHQKNGWAKPHFNHITISPDKDKIPDLSSVEQYRTYKGTILKVLKKYHASGVLLFHPYRKRTIKIKKEIAWKTDKSRTKIIEKEISFMYYSPHFHLLGNMWIPKRFYRVEGIVIKKIQNPKNKRVVKLYKEKHIKSTVNYLLTHSGYYKNTHMSSWFGHYAYNKLRPINKRVEKEIILCESCETPVYRLDIDPRDIDDRYYYFSHFWRSYLNPDYSLFRKIILYELSYFK